MKQIKLLDINFTFHVEDPSLWSECALGRAYLKEAKILVASGMNKDMEDSTLIHELVHMISDIQGLDLDEMQVSALGVGVYSLIKNNKELLSEM